MLSNEQDRRVRSASAARRAQEDQVVATLDHCIRSVGVGIAADLEEQFQEAVSRLDDLPLACVMLLLGKGAAADRVEAWIRDTPSAEATQ